MALPYATTQDVLVNAVSSITTVSAVGATYLGPVDVSHAQKLSLQVSASAVTSGNGVFTVWVSNDGTNYIKYNRLTTNATNTNAQTDARVASVTLSANTNQLVFFPAGDYFKYVQVSVAFTTDGKYSAKLLLGQ